MQGAAAAKLAAVESVRWEFQNLLPEKKAGNPEPMLYLAVIEELDDIPEDPANSGASWYPMDEG